MKNYDQSLEIHHNSKWSYFPDHPWKTLFIGSPGWGKNDVLLNLIKHQYLDFDKINFSDKDAFKSKYQLIFKGREKLGIKTLKSRKVFINSSNTVDDIYENLEDYNWTNKTRVLIVFDEIIIDKESNKISCPNVTKLILRGKKLNI